MPRIGANDPRLVALLRRTIRGLDHALRPTHRRLCNATQSHRRTQAESVARMKPPGPASGRPDDKTPRNPGKAWSKARPLPDFAFAPSGFEGSASDQPEQHQPDDGAYRRG